MAQNTLQFNWIVKVKEGIEILYAANPDVFVAGDLFWYPVKGDNTIKYAPDTMVVFGRPKGFRGSYLQWKEANIPPQVVFEILSPSNTRQEMELKLDFYQKYGAEEYYVYDPDKNILAGWLRSGKKLKPIKNINGWISPRLGIKFVLTSLTLDIYRPDNRKFATPIELEEQIQQKEQQRAEAEQRANDEKQRADTEKQRAEAEKQRADTEKQRAEAEKQRAETEKQRAEAEQQRADAERQARLNAVPQLLQTGMSTEQVAQILSLTVEEVESLR
jgi:Uma2 family endonuclease